MSHCCGPQFYSFIPFGNPFAMPNGMPPLFPNRHHCENSSWNTIFSFGIMSRMIDNMFAYSRRLMQPQRTIQQTVQPIQVVVQPQYTVGTNFDSNNYFTPSSEQDLNISSSFDYSGYFDSFFPETETSAKTSSSSKAETEVKQETKTKVTEDVEGAEEETPAPTTTTKKTKRRNKSKVEDKTPSSKTRKREKNNVNTKKLDKHFLNKVKEVAKRLNCNYKDLLAVINSESSFNPKAKNGNAVGLIQFTESARKELKRVYGINVTADDILNMSAIEQLDLVEKYLKISKSYAFSPNAKLSNGDLYAIVFLPGRANRDVLCAAGERSSNGRLLGFYEQNSPLDLNGDGKITKSELAARVDKKRVDESIFA